MRSLALLSLLLSSAVLAQPLKVATLAPEGTTWLKEMRAASDAAKAKTEGRAELKFYPGGVMGDSATVLRKIKLGQLHGGAFAAAELGEVNPDVQVYGLPFLFRTQAEVDAARVAADPLIKQGFEAKGMVAAGITGGGFIYLMGTKPIGTAEQLKSTKVWIPEGDVIGQVTFSQAGITPVQLSIGDVYTSLQTGLIETVGNTTTGAIAFQWSTKLKHMVDMPVSYTVGVLALDQRALNRLAEADRKVLLDEIAAAFVRLNTINAADDRKAKEALAKEGIAIAAPSAEEASAWQGIGDRAVAELMQRQAVSTAVYEAVIKARDAARQGAGGSP